jgi:hypothetical protein
LRRIAPAAAAHSGMDSGKRAFGGDGTRRQHGWDGMDGDPERRRGEKATDVTIGTRTRQRPWTARRLRTERGFKPGVAGRARVR